MTTTQTPDAVAVQRIAQALADLQDTAATVGLHIGLGIHGVPLDLLTDLAQNDPERIREFPGTDRSPAFSAYSRRVGDHDITMYAPAAAADVEDAA